MNVFSYVSLSLFSLNFSLIVIITGSFALLRSRKRSFAPHFLLLFEDCGVVGFVVVAFVVAVEHSDKGQMTVAMTITMIDDDGDISCKISSFFSSSSAFPCQLMTLLVFSMTMMRQCLR